MNSSDSTMMFGELKDDVTTQIVDLIEKMISECIKIKWTTSDKVSYECTVYWRFRVHEKILSGN